MNLSFIKTLVALLAALPGLGCLDLKADLGDSYAQSVRRYGQPSGRTDPIIWWKPADSGHSYIGEIFFRNQCVAIFFVPVQGYTLYESEIWRALQENSKRGIIWQQYHRDETGVDLMSSDGNLYGKLTSNGWLRIAYKSYLTRHGLFTNEGQDAGGNNIRPPVEDTNNNI